ncbi:MAG: DUF2339 domain-containing protein [Gemmatimonadota bacterium]
MDSDERDSLAQLERRLAMLEAEVRALRSEKRASGDMQLQPNTAERPTPLLSSTRPEIPLTPPRPLPAFADPAAARLPKRDWEALIGRYGTLILATVTALAAVGTFIGWAIANGWLGPAQRIVLGLMAAAALAAWGFRLRRRERSFGASLIGIALAIVHVCAWGAGPSLHLVPTAVAFALAAVASLALETFAHIEEDEVLWSVGFFGAALAPFVTSEGGGSMPLLATYGVGVLVSGGYALGNRTWHIAGRLFVFSAALYTGALMLGTEAERGPLLAMLFPIAVGYLGVLRWSGGWRRRTRLRGLGILAAAASVRAGLSIGLPMQSLVLAESIAVAGVAWLALVAFTFDSPVSDDRPGASRIAEGDRLDAGGLPLVFTFSALVALGPGAWPQGTGVGLAVAAALLLATHVRYPASGLRDGAAFATTACAALAAAFIALPHPPVMFAAMALVGAATFAADRWRPSVWWTTSGMVAMAWSMTGVLGLLGEREVYGYTPFLTSASAASAVIVAAVAAAWRLARDGEAKSLVAGGTIAWAFVWVHQEIAFAVNTTVSTLLRVSYYAATSVVAVAVGRARRMPILRHVGLGLAVIAAGTALYSARHLSSIGARIFADLVAAGFLLAIAFWYRKPGSTPQSSEPTGPPGNPA